MTRFANFPIRVKFHLLMSLLLLVLFLASAIFAYQREKQLVIRFAVDNARFFARELIETRDYISSVVKGEPEHNYNLVPQVVATQVAKRVTQNSKYYVRQVSLRYRNPANRPDQFETDQLSRFAKNPPPEVYAVVTAGPTRSFRYLQPMLATASCLECHGTYETAPRFVQERFPPGHYSYNYHVGEVIGAVSVSIPMDALYAQLGVDLKLDLLARGVVFLIVIVFMGSILRRQIVDPVQLLSEKISYVTKTGDFESKLPQARGDEIGQVFGAFNELMDELSRRTLQSREADERYRRFIELAGAAVVTFLQDGKMVIVNQKAEALLGRSRQALLGESILSFLEDGAELKQLLALGGTAQETSLKLTVRDDKGKKTKVEMVLAASQTDREPMFSAILRVREDQ